MYIQRHQYRGWYCDVGMFVTVVLNASPTSTPRAHPPPLWIKIWREMWWQQRCPPSHCLPLDCQHVHGQSRYIGLWVFWVQATLFWIWIYYVGWTRNWACTIGGAMLRGCESGDHIPNGVPLGTLSPLACPLNTSQLFNTFACYI